MNNPVKNKKELLERLSTVHAELHHFGVARFGIFGSFVRDDAHPDSDVDFFVEFDPAKKNFDNFMDLAFLLEQLVGRKIELVTPESLSKYIGPYILKEVEYVPFAA